MALREGFGSNGSMVTSGVLPSLNHGRARYSRASTNISPWAFVWAIEVIAGGLMRLDGIIRYSVAGMDLRKVREISCVDTMRH